MSIIDRTNISDDMEYREIRKINDDKFMAFAPAKINRSLRIGAVQDGFHHVSGIMQTVTLGDMVILERVKRGEEKIIGLGNAVRDTIMAKALDELTKKTGEAFHCRITYHKRIPMAAGLGGGSSDAAAVLRLANRAFDLGLDLGYLEGVAQEVGNDVPFLLRGGGAEVSGAKRHTIKSVAVPDLYYVIANLDKTLSTKAMYELFDLHKGKKSFTELAAELCGETKRLLADLRKGAVEMGVTGKGPTVFAGYETYDDCENASRGILWLGYNRIFRERPTERFVDPMPV